MGARTIDEIRAELYACLEMRDGDLATAVLWVAAEEYPGLDLQRYLAFLDDCADAIRDRGARLEAGHDCRAAIAEELYSVRGFVGDRTDYYDPKNSYLNEVIDRRRGIPISLAIIFHSVASRLGRPAHGVNAPGHFLLRIDDCLIDPFDEGAEVTDAAFRAHLQRAGAPDPEALARELQHTPPTRREIVSRVLSNLKGKHLRRGDFARALSAVDRLVELNPEQPNWLRDRGVLYQRLDCTPAAVADLEAYLDRVPDDPEADVIREALRRLQTRATTLH